MCINVLFTSCTLYFVRDDKNKAVQSISIFLTSNIVSEIVKQCFLISKQPVISSRQVPYCIESGVIDSAIVPIGK